MEQKKLLHICDTLLREVKRDSSILHCHRFDQTSSIWNMTYHDHAYFELLYFIKGEARIEGDHSHSRLGTNDLIIYPPYFGHKEFIDLTRHQEAICLGLALRPDFTFTEALTINDPEHELEWLFTRLHRQYQNNQKEITDQIKLLLFHYIRECCLIDNTAAQPMSLRIINYMEQHYSEKLYQKELADIVQCQLRLYVQDLQAGNRQNFHGLPEQPQNFKGSVFSRQKEYDSGRDRLPGRNPRPQILFQAIQEIRGSLLPGITQEAIETSLKVASSYYSLLSNLFNLFVLRTLRPSIPPV